MKLTVIIEKEKTNYTARCIEVEVYSQGKTAGQALDNIREALELFVESNKKKKAFKQIEIATLDVGDKK